MEVIPQTADPKGRRNLQISLGVRCELVTARQREKEETLGKGLWDSAAEIILILSGASGGMQNL